MWNVNLAHIVSQGMSINPIFLFHVFYIAQMFDSMCDSIITGHGQFSIKKKEK